MKQAKWIRGVMLVLAVALVSSCGKKNDDSSGVAGINSGLYGAGGVVGSNCVGYGSQGASIGVNFQAQFRACIGERGDVFDLSSDGCKMTHR